MTDKSSGDAAPVATRCGFVALIGAPNVGKSTLVNALVGSKVTIVSRKVQTTRALIRGIVIENNAQINLRLGSPIVMLSACKTGLGQLRKGEGLIGLTRAFVYAGAKDVGVSLWPVDDNSTAQLMSGFYSRLLPAKNASASSSATPPEPAAALRAAQIDMITGRKYSPPYFWAPFILVGQ